MISLSHFSKHFTNIHTIWISIVIVFTLNFISVYTKYMLSVSTVIQQNDPVRVTDDLQSHAVINRHIMDLNIRPNSAYTHNVSLFKSDNPDNGSISMRKKLEGEAILNKTQNSLGSYLKTNNVDGFLYNESRPYSCDNCFPTYLKFQGANICNTNDQVDIIILITTAHANIRQRMALRTTWLTRTRQNTAKVRYVFLVGHNVKYTKQIVSENQKFNDLVIANFTDTYKNLTLKTLAGYRWVKQSCSQAKVVMKTDDDVYVNIGALISFSEKYDNNLKNTMFGACWIRKPIRWNKSKYFVSNLTYSNESYPKVCSGTGYVTSARVISKILDISPNVPFFYLEDVYVAFCLQQLGIKSHKHQGFISGALRKNISPCVYRANTVISAHVKSAMKISSIWKYKCPKHFS